MAVVKAIIKNRITAITDDVELVCNNPTDVIEIEFDDEWSGKTGYVARFEWNGKYYDVPFTGSRVRVPELSNTAWVMFGVYADNITAAPVKVKCKKSILCYGDGVRQVPANPFYDEFVKRLENVEEAIENGTGGSGGSIVQETDPTVPAWAKQPEKPTYTAEEVGALPADTEIPTPYTLPTASDTVKGGVMIGEGLQMDGDVLGVVPEREYELIETITVEEDIERIVRNQAPDGTPYDFSDIYILLEAPAYSENRRLYISIGNTDSTNIWANDKLAYFTNSAIVGMSANTSECFVNKSNGIFENRFVSPGTRGTVVRLEANHPEVIDGTIKAVRFFAYGNTTNLIPAGVQIKIWGVRANA